MLQASLRFPDDSGTFYRCIIAEQERSTGERGSYIVKQDEKKSSVIFDVKAKDAVILRALCNGIIKQYLVFEQILHIK